MLNVKIISLKGVEVDEQAASVNVPTTSGQITVLPNHSPLISELKEGELVVKTASAEKRYAVKRGVLEVRKGSQVVVLSEV